MSPDHPGDCVFHVQKRWSLTKGSRGGLRIMALLCVPLLLLRTQAALANDDQPFFSGRNPVYVDFLPGDACFSAIVDKEVIAAWQESDEIQLKYKGSPRYVLFQKTEHVGTSKCRISKASKPLVQNLLKAFRQLRSQSPSVVETFNFDDEDEEELPYSQEANPIYLFVHRKSFPHTQHPFLCRFNEKWLQEGIAAGASDLHGVLRTTFFDDIYSQEEQHREEIEPLIGHGISCDGTTVHVGDAADIAIFVVSQEEIRDYSRKFSEGQLSGPVCRCWRVTVESCEEYEMEEFGLRPVME